MSGCNFNPLVVFLLQKQLRVIALEFHGAQILITELIISLLWPLLFLARSGVSDRRGGCTPLIKARALI